MGLKVASDSLLDVLHQLLPCSPCFGKNANAQEPLRGCKSRQLLDVTQSDRRKVSTNFVAIHAANASVLQRLPTDLPEHNTVTRKNLVVYLVRHAEAEHNVLEKRAEYEARMHGDKEEEIERARAGVLSDPDLLNASLSKNGQKQVKTCAGGFSEMIRKTHYKMPDAIYVSPLYRTLQTATILFPSHGNMQALELLREKRTGHPCDERGNVVDFKDDFPHIDFEAVVKQDRLSSDGYVFREELKEDNEAVEKRAQRLMDFLYSQTSDCIAIVTHKALLRELNKHTLAGVMDEEGSQLATVFGNAEMRVCEISWDRLGTPTVRARSLKDATARPPMVVKDFSPHEHAASKLVAARLPTMLSNTSLRSLIGDDTFVEPCPAAVEGGGLRVAVGVSHLPKPGAAAVAAWRSMEEKLGGVPSFALVALHSDVDRSAVVAALRPLAGACWVIGGTSMCGVLSSSTTGRVGITGFQNFAYSIGLGIVRASRSDDMDDVQAQAAAQTAQATRCAPPDLIFTFMSTGLEDAVLEGIKEGCSGCEDVPVIGGTCATDSIDDEHWWMLYGSMAGWSTLTHGAVICCVSLFSDVSVSSLLSNCYAPTHRKAKLTRVTDRTIHEIDGRPAAQWMKEATGVHGSPGQDLMDDMALWPLAVTYRGQNRLVMVKSVGADGKNLECFASLESGSVRLLHLKACDLIGAVAAVVQTALSRASYDVKGALLIICAGLAAAMPNLQELLDALPGELPEVLVCFTFGEVGMLEGNSYFGNLMVNISLFG